MQFLDAVTRDWKLYWRRLQRSAYLDHVVLTSVKCFLSLALPVNV